MDNKKSFKAFFKNGKLHYEHQGISREGLDKLKFFIEGQTVHYRVQSTDKDQQVEMKTIISGEVINPVVFKRGNIKIGSPVFDPDVDVLRPFSVESIFTVIKGIEKFDPETFVFELNNFKPRQRGRVVGHKYKHFVLYYGVIEPGECPDYIFAYPIRDARAFFVNLHDMCDPRNGLSGLIEEEGLLPQSLYFKITLKKEYW